MFFLLLTSTEDNDIEYWSSQIKDYKRLLELQSFGFNVTKLASTRMSLLCSVNEESLAHSPSSITDYSSSESASGFFEGDLMVELGDSMS